MRNDEKEKKKKNDEKNDIVKNILYAWRLLKKNLNY